MEEDRELPQVLTVSEAAGILRVSARTVREMARTGRVPSRKVGREWRFLRSAIEEWLAREAGPGADGQVRAPAGTPPAAAESMQYELPLPGFRDTAFSENRDRTLHRWVPWIAGFSGSFVSGVLDGSRAGRGRLRVLDPFAGVGTTLIEALKHGDDAIGFEINPWAALACKAKTGAAHYDVERLETLVDRFEELAEKKPWMDAGTASVPPAGFRSRVPFFSPAVEPQALACRDFIAAETQGWVRDLFRVAFGAVMVGFSNYSYEPSLGTRAAAGKAGIEDADVFGTVLRKLREMREDIVAFQRSMSRFKRLPRSTIHPSSYFDDAGRVEPQSIDVVVTSPPYLNNYHYIRNTRPHLFWLGMVSGSDDLKEIEHKSFGQFWQTVRTGPEIPLRPPLPHLAAQLKDLRDRNAEKGAYGGPGWANYAATYFNDCQRFCALARTSMRSRQKVCK